MTIYSPSDRSPGPYFHQAGTGKRSGLKAINLLGYNPGSVSDLILACPYFKRARVLLYEGEPWVSAKLCRIPRGEVVLPIGPNLKRVTDPPHVAGNDQPSGGATTAIAEAYWGASPNGGYHITCSLAEPAHALCYAVLAWQHMHWLLPLKPS
jgi:hypothetical protein